MLPVIAPLIAFPSASHINRCGLTAESMLPAGSAVPKRVFTETPHEKRRRLGAAAPPLPEALDWSHVNGTSFTNRVGYQLIPSPCGSCWAFAATGALSDRVKIATGALLPEFNLAPQGLLDCAAPKAGSCNGGSHTLANEFAANNPLSDETCLPYRGMDHSNWGETDCAERMCRRCDRFGTCSFLPANATPGIKVEEHGTVKGVEEMKAEIAARGPIACLMYAHSQGFDSYTGGVITDPTRYDGITHVVTVTGWGKEGNTSFWKIRNSFGTQWGELGYYRQEVGKDVFNMESHDCAWATPDGPSIDGLLRRGGPLPARH
jgi:cathepsin X